MSALITTLIDKVDNAEAVRDQIATILLVESMRQQELAVDAGKNPADWKLRIFLERSNPWEVFLADRPTDESPVVNVAFDAVTYDQSKSNVVERQHAVGIYHVDCYGYGISQTSTEDYESQKSGDELASLEAQRALRLCRNILMAGAYTYLASRGVVGGRFPQQAQMFHPAHDSRPVQHVMGARLTMQVDFNEFSPQVQGQPFEQINVAVKRASDGLLYFENHFPT